MPKIIRDESWFMARVRKTDTCWLWTGAGSNSSNGYGRVGRGGASRFSGSRLAHRWSYEWFVGRVPEGFQLDHLCRVRNCVNPQHLEPVTPRENTRRSPATPAALLRARTECSEGHPLDYVSPDGRYRACRKCKNAWQREYRRRKKESVAG